MNFLRVLTLLTVVLLVGCSWKPGMFSRLRAPLHYPDGISVNLWDRCTDWVLNYLKQEPDVTELSDAELDCLISLLMDKCVVAEARVKAKQGIVEMTDPEVLLQELRERQMRFCGSGGQNASKLVMKIWGETNFGEVGSEAAPLCPPVMQ